MTESDQPPALTWRKSTASSDSGHECVEVACAVQSVLVRDSKDKDGSRLTISAQAWQAFLNRIKGGDFGKGPLWSPARS
jgi:hypothetical protein